MFRKDLVLLVVGSLTAKEADRTLTRSDIVTVQAITSLGEILPCRYFDSFGALGISSMAFNLSDYQMFFSTGIDLYKVDLISGDQEVLSIPNLMDIHEMDFIDGQLFLANTGNDEVISIDLDSRVVSRQRINCRRSQLDVAENESATVDRYHLNQIFKGLDGNLYGLVHHVEGKQLLRRIAARILKSHGNGGCLRLNDGYQIPLGLHAPHTVSVVGDEYWVFDSGKALIRVLDRKWNTVWEIPTAGWGRGSSVVMCGRQRIFAAGLSNIRRRYLDLFEHSDNFINGFQLFDTTTRKELYRQELTQIEQVNNVYFVEKAAVEKLLG